MKTLIGLLILFTSFHEEVLAQYFKYDVLSKADFIVVTTVDQIIEDFSSRTSSVVINSGKSFPSGLSFPVVIAQSSGRGVLIPSDAKTVLLHLSKGENQGYFLSNGMASVTPSSLDLISATDLINSPSGRMDYGQTLSKFYGREKSPECMLFQSHIIITAPDAVASDIFRKNSKSRMGDAGRFAWLLVGLRSGGEEFLQNEAGLSGVVDALLSVKRYRNVAWIKSRSCFFTLLSERIGDEGAVWLLPAVQAMESATAAELIKALSPHLRKSSLPQLYSVLKTAEGAELRYVCVKSIYGILTPSGQVPSVDYYIKNEAAYLAEIERFKAGGDVLRNVNELLK